MWTTGKTINTPKGAYTATSDDAAAELVKAARFAGLEAFDVTLDDTYIDDASDLPSENLSEIAGNLTVVAHDTAG